MARVRPVAMPGKTTVRVSGLDVILTLRAVILGPRGGTVLGAGRLVLRFSKSSSGRRAVKIECPRCGEQVEYSPGVVQACPYCQVSLRLPEVNQLPEHLRSQWFKEQAAAKAKEEKRRQKLEAEERRRKEKERQAARENQLAPTRTETQTRSHGTAQSPSEDEEIDG